MINILTYQYAQNISIKLILKFQKKYFILSQTSIKVSASVVLNYFNFPVVTFLIYQRSWSHPNGQMSHRCWKMPME